MKKILFILVVLLLSSSMYATPTPTPTPIPVLFSITPVQIYTNSAVIAFPRYATYTSTTLFNVMVDGVLSYQTNWYNSKSNASSVTTTVSFDGSKSSHVITAWETGNGNYYYLSNPFTIVLPPQVQQAMTYNEGLAYNPQNIIEQSWAQSVSATVDVMDTSFNANVFIDQITVCGAVAGNVAVKINGTIFKNYSYSAGSCIPPDTLVIKQLIPQGQFLEDTLVTGTTGIHSISIIGEVIK
jgi:hypothetical protein